MGDWRIKQELTEETETLFSLWPPVKNLMNPFFLTRRSLNHAEAGQADGEIEQELMEREN